MVVEVDCGVCGDTFETYQSRLDREGRGQYCSRECSDVSKRHPDTIEVQCANCDELVTIQPSRQDSMGDYELKNHFCSKECESEWKSENWRGENHPTWQGGSPDFYGESWPEQRRKAIKRDGWRCQDCGITQREHRDQSNIGLDVHHKTPVTDFDNRNDAHELDNLVTLCRSCHRTREPPETRWR